MKTLWKNFINKKRKLTDFYFTRQTQSQSETTVLTVKKNINTPNSSSHILKIGYCMLIEVDKAYIINILNFIFLFYNINIYMEQIHSEECPTTMYDNFKTTVYPFLISYGFLLIFIFLAVIIINLISNVDNMVSLCLCALIYIPLYYLTYIGYFMIKKRFFS